MGDRTCELLILDADGTLADRDTQALLPGVARFFEALRGREAGERPRIAIVTNQGGVGVRYWMETEGWGDPASYPSREEIETRYPALLARLLQEVPYRFYVAYRYRDRRGRWGPVPPGEEENPRWRRDWRKPAPGMLHQAMADAGVGPQATLMVGDSEDDRLAAERAGCAFVWARHFFDTAPAAGESLPPGVPGR